MLLSWMEALAQERVCSVVLVARTGHVHLPPAAADKATYIHVGDLSPSEVARLCAQLCGQLVQTSEADDVADASAATAAGGSVEQELWHLTGGRVGDLVDVVRDATAAAPPPGGTTAGILEPGRLDAAVEARVAATATALRRALVPADMGDGADAGAGAARGDDGVAEGHADAAAAAGAALFDVLRLARRCAGGEGPPPARGECDAAAVDADHLTAALLSGFVDAVPGDDGGDAVCAFVRVFVCVVWCMLCCAACGDALRGGGVQRLSMGGLRLTAFDRIVRVHRTAPPTAACAHFSACLILSLSPRADERTGRAGPERPGSHV